MYFHLGYAKPIGVAQTDPNELQEHRFVQIKQRDPPMGGVR